MLKHRQKGNDTLRRRLKSFLKGIPSGEEIRTNHLVMEFQKAHHNYSLSSVRISSLLKEFTTSVRWLKAGIWIKL